MTDDDDIFGAGDDFATGAEPAFDANLNTAAIKPTAKRVARTSQNNDDTDDLTTTDPEIDSLDAEREKELADLEEDDEYFFGGADNLET